MFSFLLRRVVLVALVVPLPFVGSGGCGSRTACFEYSQPEYVVNGNSCPAQSTALANFSDPNCPGPVVSVDGAGTFDGELCCYPVTYDSITPDCGSGGNVGAGGGFTGTTSDFSTSEVGTGPGSSGSTCSATCNTALKVGSPPCNGLAAMDYTALQTCGGCFGGLADDGGTPCTTTTDCFSNLCSTLPLTPECFSCLMSSCTVELNACISN